MHKTRNESLDKRSWELLPSFFFQGSRLLKNDSEVLLTDSNQFDRNWFDWQFNFKWSQDRWRLLFLFTLIISKFLDYSNFAPLLAEQLSKKLNFFILLRYCSFTQGNLNAFVRSKIYIILSKWWGKERSLEQFVCFQSLNIRINMTQCVTSATAEWHLSLVFMIITKCRGKN